MATEAIGATAEAPKEAEIVDAKSTKKSKDLNMPDVLSSEMGKDAFLKLLTTQLTNQDPMNPMEDHNFVAQLATFSHLETSTQHTSLFEKMNEKLEEISGEINALKTLQKGTDGKNDSKVASADGTKNFDAAEEAVSARRQRAMRYARAYNA